MGLCLRGAGVPVQTRPAHGSAHADLSRGLLRGPDRVPGPASGYEAARGAAGRDSQWPRQVERHVRVGRSDSRVRAELGGTPAVATLQALGRVALRGCPHGAEPGGGNLPDRASAVFGRSRSGHGRLGRVVRTRSIRGGGPEFRGVVDGAASKPVQGKGDPGFQVREGGTHASER